MRSHFTTPSLYSRSGKHWGIKYWLLLGASFISYSGGRSKRIDFLPQRWTRWAEESCGGEVTSSGRFQWENCAKKLKLKSEAGKGNRVEGTSYELERICDFMDVALAYTGQKFISESHTFAINHHFSSVSVPRRDQSKKLLKSPTDSTHQRKSNAKTFKETSQLSLLV